MKPLKALIHVTILIFYFFNLLFKVWDTAGQERYRAITSAYYRGAVGAVLVYDITKQKTYESVTRWMEELKEHASDQIVVMLVGNKCDLRHLQAIPTDEVTIFAKEKKLLFVEASALDATNVEELFKETIEKVHQVQIKKLKEELRNANKDEVSEEPNIDLMKTPTKKQCCQT